MRKRFFQLATAALLTAGMASSAQISSPDKLVAPVPRNPAGRSKLTQTNGDGQWLWQFTKPEPNGRVNDLRVDARFQALVDDNFKQPQAMWGAEDHSLPLAQVIPLFLTKYGEALQENNRYFVADGCVPSFCPASGLLWIDLGAKNPLMVFAAVNWSTTGHTTEEKAADYNLWLFPNRNLSPSDVPFALTEAIAHWDARLTAAHRLVPHIQHALLIEPNGSPYALDPAQVGANTLPTQLDTVTPHTDND